MTDWEPGDTNSSTNSTMDGSLALYFHRDDKVLAQAIYDAMCPYLKYSDAAIDPGNFKGFGLDRFASGVLLKSDMPAAMMEPLFMSNPAEASLLVTPIPGCNNCRRAQIAQALHDGIVSYFAGPEPTPTPKPSGVVHVASIDMSLRTRGPWTNAVAAVAIVNADSVPVEGAAVSGHWSGATSDSDTGVTGADGEVSLESDKVKNALGGTTFTFTVDNVVLSGWTYDSSANTTGSITIP